MRAGARKRLTRSFDAVLAVAAVLTIVAPHWPWYVATQTPPVHGAPFDRLNRQVYERHSRAGSGAGAAASAITRRCDARSPSRTRCLTRSHEEPRYPMGEVKDQ